MLTRIRLTEEIVNASHSFLPLFLFCRQLQTATDSVNSDDDNVQPITHHHSN